MRGTKSFKEEQYRNQIIEAERSRAIQFARESEAVLRLPPSADEVTLVRKFIQRYNLSAHHTTKRFSSVLRKYRDERWYYEVVLFSHRLVTSSVMLFITPASVCTCAVVLALVPHCLGCTHGFDDMPSLRVKSPLDC